MRKLLWMAALAIGCGGCGGPSSPAIDNSRHMNSLNSAEQMEYCAWQTATLGGEGHQLSCGPIQATLSVDNCLQQFAHMNGNCSAATYGNYRACTTLMSKDCSNLTLNADCLAVFMCDLLI